MIYFIESENYIYIGCTRQKLKNRINGHIKKAVDYINEKKKGKKKRINICKSFIPLFEGNYKYYSYDDNGGFNEERNYIKNLITYKTVVNRFDILFLLNKIFKK